jgi:hypothetical protein
MHSASTEIDQGMAVACGVLHTNDVGFSGRGAEPSSPHALHYIGLRLIAAPRFRPMSDAR